MKLLLGFGDSRGAGDKLTLRAPTGRSACAQPWLMYRSTISDTDGQKVKEVLDRTRLAVMKTASQVVLGVLAARFCMMRRGVGGAVCFFTCAIVLSAGHFCEPCL